MRYLRYFRPHLLTCALVTSLALVFAVAMVAVGPVDARAGVLMFVAVSVIPLLTFGFIEGAMLFYSWRQVRRP